MADPEPPKFSDISEQEVSDMPEPKRTTPEPPEFSDISEQEVSEMPEPLPKESKGKFVAAKDEKAKPSAVKRSERLTKRQRVSYDESEYEEEAVDEDDVFKDDDMAEEDDVAPTSLKGKAKRSIYKKAAFLSVHKSRAGQKLFATQSDYASGGKRIDERHTDESTAGSSNTATTGAQAIERELTEPPALAEIDAISELRNVKLLKKKLEVLELIKRVDPPKVIKDFFEEIRAGEPIEGREFDIERTYQERGRWVVEIIDLKDKTNRVSGRGYTSRVVLEQGMASNEATATALMDEYCRLLERFPYPWQKNGTARVFMRWLLETAKRNTDPAWKASLPKLAHNHNTAGGVIVRFMYYDTDTSEFQRYTIATTHKTIDLSVPPPPPIPSWINLQQPDPPGDLSGTELQQWIRCFEIVRYMTFKLRGQVGNKNSMKALVASLRELYTIPRDMKTGPYGGHAILFTSVAIEERVTIVGAAGSVNASFAAKGNVSGKTSGAQKNLPRITIKGLSRTRARQVASAIKQTWCRTGNIIEAWQSGCLTADLLNQRIVDDEVMGTSDCGCAEEMRQSEIHSCSLCGRPAFCASLQYVPELQVRACAGCMATRVVAEHKTLAWLKKKLRSSIQAEQDARQVPQANRKAELEEMWSAFLDEIQDPDTQAITSALTGRTFPPTDKTMLGHPYRAASVDAAFPLVRDDNGLRLHYQGNLCLMELTLNLLKWRYPPGVLQFLSDWMNSNREEAHVLELYARMHAIAKIMIDVPYTLKTRLSQKLSEARYQEFQREFLTCERARSMTSKGSYKLQRYTVKFEPRAPSANFVPPEHERVKKLIEKIEHKYASTGKVLRKSEDGCPFPFQCAMPKNWSWWRAWVLFGERLFRMWLLCNCLWIQVECTETIFIECIIQFFEPCGLDPLQLPLSIYNDDPLKFSIGKIDHNRGMTTRCKTHTPSCLEDFDLDRLNISFEPWIVNLMKGRYAAESYPKMAEVVKAATVPQRWYQRPAVQSSEIETTTEQFVADADSTSLNDDEEGSFDFDDEMNGDDDLYPAAGDLEGDGADEDEDED